MPTYQVCPARIAQGAYRKAKPAGGGKGNSLEPKPVQEYRKEGRPERAPIVGIVRWSAGFVNPTPKLVMVGPRLPKPEAVMAVAAREQIQ